MITCRKIFIIDVCKIFLSGTLYAVDYGKDRIPVKTQTEGLPITNVVRMARKRRKETKEAEPTRKLYWRRKILKQQGDSGCGKVMIQVLQGNIFSARFADQLLKLIAHRKDFYFINN